MIGIVLVGHERIAAEMRLALEHVVGEQPLIETLDVAADTNPEELAASLRTKIRACDAGKGVMVLADMFGGTPCNTAMGCLDGNVVVVSGVSLPLLIKAAMLRNQPIGLRELADRAVEAGHQYMAVAPDIRRTKE